MNEIFGTAQAEVTTDEREKLRTALEARLDADWPIYIRKVLAGALPAA